MRENGYIKLDEKYNELIQNNLGEQWTLEYLKFISEHDDRYLDSQISSEIIAESEPFTLHRLMRMMDGIYFAHTITLKNRKIKVRLLTVQEYEELTLEVAQILEDKPILKNIDGMGAILLQRKILSLATSVYMPKSNHNKHRINKKFRMITEKEIAELPMIEFNYFVSEYTKIEQEYNVAPDEMAPKVYERFIEEILNQKKNSLENVVQQLNGLTLSEALKIIMIFVVKERVQRENEQFGTSLDCSTTDVQN